VEVPEEKKPTAQSSSNEEKFLKGLEEVDKLLRRAKLVREQATDQKELTSETKKPAIKSSSIAVDCKQCKKGACPTHKPKQKSDLRRKNSKEHALTDRKPLKVTSARSKQKPTSGASSKKHDLTRQHLGCGDVVNSSGKGNEMGGKQKDPETKEDVGKPLESSKTSFSAANNSVQEISIALEDVCKDTACLKKYKKLLSVHAKLTSQQCCSMSVVDAPLPEESSFIAKLKGKNGDSKPDFTFDAANNQLSKFSRYCENLLAILSLKEDLLHSHSTVVKLHQDRILCTYSGRMAEELEAFFQFILSARVLPAQTSSDASGMSASTEEVRNDDLVTAFDCLSFASPRDWARLAECRSEILWLRALGAVRDEVHDVIMKKIKSLSPTDADSAPSNDFIACVKTMYGLLAQRQGVSAVPAIIWVDDEDT